MSRNRYFVLATIGCLTLSAIGLGIHASTPDGEQVETGYLVSLRGHTLAISNVAMGGGGSGSGQPQMRMVRREPEGMQRMTPDEANSLGETMKAAGIPRGTAININESNGEMQFKATSPDGKPYVLTAKQKKALQDFESRNSGQGGQQGGGTRIEMTEENGERRYKLTGPDGKTRILTPEEMKEMEKKMQEGGGGHVVRMRASEDGAEAGASNQVPTERKKVSFSKFEITGETKMPEDLERGTQIKVYYRIDGDKKIATKVEAVI